ncbi:class I adenylate-forming enzyme family protein [Streptomyces sp. NPDC023723]|uniref:class I adenylate-forming enzyme family protein n=1 Tax=Streptomyces sp. NPDC023723 TaxID=3154323 RepID=UPI00340E8B45
MTATAYPDPGTVPDLLAARAAGAAHRPAVRHRDTTLTWAELAASVGRARARLRRDGPAPGARLGLLARNDPGTLVALLAATAEGREVVLYDARATADERARVAARAGLTGWRTPGPDSGTAEAAGTGPPAAYLDLVTSGTGGLPKVVRKDWRVTVANAAAFVALAGYRGADRILCTTPLHHAYALGVAVLPALLTGAALHLAPHPAAPATLGRLIRDGGITVVQSVPFLYRAVLASDVPLAPNALRLCVSAGEPLSAATADAWRDATGVAPRDQYGSTEFGQIGYAADAPGGPLRLLPGVTARLRAPDGGWLTAPGPDDLGELHLRQEGAMPVVYRGLPGLSAASHHDGWFRTGDTGRLPAPGQLTVTGRVTRRISVAGRKVDPREVERAVLAVPGVRECWVAAPPEDAGGPGDRFAAFVAADAGVTEIAVRRQVARVLSAYKVPTRFHLRAALPRTGTGKVHTARLWQEAGEDRCHDRGPTGRAQEGGAV